MRNNLFNLLAARGFKSRGRHELEFGRYPVPIGTHNFLTGRYPTSKISSVPGTQLLKLPRYPVRSGTQNFEILMGTRVPRMPTPDQKFLCHIQFNLDQFDYTINYNLLCYQPYALFSRNFADRFQQAIHPWMHPRCVSVKNRRFNPDK